MQLGIIGSSGLVGQELAKLCPSSCRLIQRVKKEDLEGLDVAFFCATNEVSKTWIPIALEMGIFVIDSSSYFRDKKGIPLIIPEINGHLLDKNTRLVSSPNCTATVMLMALYPIYKAFGIEKVVASTYQAASGAGKNGLMALETEETLSPFPYPLQKNLFLHESPKDQLGYSEEENKVIFEISKILHSNFPVEIRSVRVPVERCHSVSLFITLEKEGSKEEIDLLLSNMQGLKIDPSPCPLLAKNSYMVWTTPARMDRFNKKSLSLFVVADQLLKGAALNAYQIYEKMKENQLFIRQ
ncbi:MAG: hypothetical protein FJZ56_01280 [Chlamydiae bacterium]|nr:hypothetical protein [Chlamydiota bacterium]